MFEVLVYVLMYNKMASLRITRRSLTQVMTSSMSSSSNKLMCSQIFINHNGMRNFSMQPTATVTADKMATGMLYIRL